VEFPHIQALYDELKPQNGLVISLALPPRDSMEYLMRSNNTTLPVGLEEKDFKDTTSFYSRWDTGVKQWYVIDSSRKIYYSGNYNPAKIRAALAQVGLTWEKKGKAVSTP
jgi:hypothetical protein